MSEAAEEAKKEAAKQLVQIVAMLIIVAISMAVHNPDFFKTVKMKIAYFAQRQAGRFARRTGDMSMGAELRTGRQQYAIPYYLSLVRDKAAAFYEKARSH